MNKRKTPIANLENKRLIFLEIGFILALVAVLYAFEYKTFDQIVHLKDYDNNYQEEEELPPLVLKEEQELPEIPKPQTQINIVDDKTIVDDLFIPDVFDLPDEPVEIWYPEPEPDIVDDEVHPYYSVSVKPEFPGGESDLLRFLAKHYKIPRIDKEMGNQGKIYVGFVIDKDGNVINTYIERGLSPTLDAEALRVVNMMPKWKPGQQGIKKVAVSFILPIHVKLM